MQISINYTLWRNDTLSNFFLSPFSMMDRSLIEYRNADSRERERETERQRKHYLKKKAQQISISIDFGVMTH